MQDDRLGILTSVTVCGFTRDSSETPIFRVAVAPSERNRLQAPSCIMVDKVTTIAADKLGYRIGQVDDEDMLRVNRALLVHLGLAGSPQAD